MPLRVFYDERQVVDQPGHASPSSGKPKLVIEEWQKQGFPIEICPVQPVEKEDFERVHHPSFVSGILNGTIDNGFGNKSKLVADSLFWTSGSLLSAAKDTLKTGTVACSPTSGFHHGTYAKAMGFCTFNGLMVTAMSLINEGLATEVGILDLDHHYGNGTDDIIYTLQLDSITHYTIGGESLHFHETAEGTHLTQADEWMNRLPQICRSFVNCDIVLYQAGGDLWEGDPYAWYGGLDVDQMRLRDRTVFESMRDMKIPVVWNLAGGYKRDEEGSIAPVLKLHNQTIEECCAAYSLS